MRRVHYGLENNEKSLMCTVASHKALHVTRWSCVYNYVHGLSHYHIMLAWKYQSVKQAVSIVKYVEGAVILNILATRFVHSTKIYSMCIVMLSPPLYQCIVRVANYSSNIIQHACRQYVVSYITSTLALKLAWANKC